MLMLMRLRNGTKTLPPKGCADFNIHWLDNTDQSLVIVDGGNRGTMKKTTKGGNKFTANRNCRQLRWKSIIDTRNINSVRSKVAVARSAKKPVKK